MRILLIIVLMFLCCVLPAYGQPGPAPEVTSGVPADVFNYFAWAAGVIIVALVGTCVFLFRKILKAETDRRTQVEELLKEQMIIMTGALEQTTKMNSTLEKVCDVLVRVEAALKEFE